MWFFSALFVLESTQKVAQKQIRLQMTLQIMMFSSFQDFSNPWLWHFFSGIPSTLSNIIPGTHRRATGLKFSSAFLSFFLCKGTTFDLFQFVGNFKVKIESLNYIKQLGLKDNLRLTVSRWRHFAHMNMTYRQLEGTIWKDHMFSDF